jgi:hypothetical protein
MEMPTPSVKSPTVIDRLRRTKVRFARDSPLEESGFEPSVPLLRKGLPGVAE